MCTCKHTFFSCAKSYEIQHWKASPFLIFFLVSKHLFSIVLPSEIRSHRESILRFYFKDFHVNIATLSTLKLILLQISEVGALLLSHEARFNKREDEFSSMREYNDYLEGAAVIMYNLINGVDVAGIEAQIAKYQEENAEQIIVNRARMAEELAAALAASKGQPAQTDDDRGANQNSQAGYGAVPQGQYAPIYCPTFPGGQPRPTGMGLHRLPPGGGDILGDASDDDDKETKRLKDERVARAGGWSIKFSRERALQEALGSIWFY